MRRILFSVCVFLLATGFIHAEGEPAKVGKVYVVGNDRVDPAEIRRMVGVYPGQSLQLSEIRSGEEKLAISEMFVVDSTAGIRPTVTVVEVGDSIFKDIVINVREAPTTSQNCAVPEIQRPTNGRIGFRRGFRR